MRAHPVSVLLVALLLPGVVPANGASESDASGPCGAAAAHPGGEWRSYGADLANSRTQPLEAQIGPDEVADLEEAWAFDAGADAGSVINTTPIVADGCVFVVPSSGEVVALHADTGEEVWRTALEATPQGYGGGVVGAPGLDDGRLIVVINRAGSPYLAGLDVDDGAVAWETVIDDTPTSITNASVTAFDGMAFVGFSGSPAGSPGERGGFVIVDAADGALLAKTYTIPDDDFDAGYYGASIWSTAAVDLDTGHAYVGTGNPHSDRVEHERTNALIKVDVDPGRDTFGEIVASYKGQPDSYIAGVDQQPVCQDLPPVYYFAGSSFDATCGQLDLDFGASPNLFTDSEGALVVGALQKSGVYHAARAETMEPLWEALLGLPCLACNASSAAVAGDTVHVAASPPGQLFGLAADDGGYEWVMPTAGGLHYFSVSAANGVVYTTDTYATLNAYDAETGLLLAKHPLGFSYTGPQAGSLGVAGSSGVAIARNTLYVAHGPGIYAYRLP